MFVLVDKGPSAFSGSTYCQYLKIVLMAIDESLFSGDLINIDSAEYFFQPAGKYPLKNASTEPLVIIPTISGD